MWSPGPDRTVTCIACGTELDRSDAREYDKYGDRWDREGKSFEYFCKPCYRELTKVDRRDLEDRLEAVGAGHRADEEFVDRFLAAADRPESDCE
ncbi:MAG: hypothetical protein ABEJ76_08010 [Halanaeroarchaeum sp.]